MGIKKRITIGLIIMALCILGTSAVSAALIHGGKLSYLGGQTDQIVFSKIEDVNRKDTEYFNLVAYVDVCSTTYSSGWKLEFAYSDSPRKWYCNERSYYDFKPVP